MADEKKGIGGITYIDDCGGFSGRMFRRKNRGDNHDGSDSGRDKSRNKGRGEGICKGNCKRVHCGSEGKWR